MTKVDQIMEYIRESVETNTPLPAHKWVDLAFSLTALISEEQKTLFELQQQVAIAKVKYIELGDSVAKAKARVEASDVYRNMKNQDAKVENIVELIRVAKLQARVAQSDYQAN